MFGEAVFTTNLFLIYETFKLNNFRSDEQNCQFECAELEFKCEKTGKCVSLVKRCDGKKDCSDGSDEDDAICSMFKLTFYYEELNK